MCGSDLRLEATDDAPYVRGLEAKLAAAEADLLHFMDGTLDYQPLVKERDAALAKLDKLTEQSMQLLARVRELEVAPLLSHYLGTADRIVELEGALRECAEASMSFGGKKPHYWDADDCGCKRCLRMHAAVAHARRVLEEKP